MDATRNSLLSAIKDPGNRTAWADFYALYGGYVRSIALASSARPTGDEVEEVVQQVFVDIAQGKLRYQRGRGSFRALLKTAVRRRCIDQIRKRRPDQVNRVHRDAGDTRETATLDRLVDNHAPETHRRSDEEWRLLVAEETRREVMRKAPPRQFQIFEVRVVRRWEVQRVMTTLGVNRNKVDLAVSRVGKIYKEVAQKVAASLDNPAIPKRVVVPKERDR